MHRWSICLAALIPAVSAAAPLTHAVPVPQLSISASIGGRPLSIAQTVSSQGAGFVAHTRVDNASLDVSSPKLDAARAAGFLAALLALGGQHDAKQLGAVLSFACKKRGVQCQVGTVSASVTGLRRGSFVSAFEQTNAALVGGGLIGTSNSLRDYASAIAALGVVSVAKIGAACLSSPIADIHNPDCVVEDRANVDNSVVDTVPSCAAARNAPPCWRYESNPQCPQVINPVDHSVTQGSIKVDRPTSSIPPGSHLSVACATLAHAG